jgi:hypothetical protein
MRVFAFVLITTLHRIHGIAAIGFLSLIAAIGMLLDRLEWQTGKWVFDFFAGGGRNHWRTLHLVSTIRLPLFMLIRLAWLIVAGAISVLVAVSLGGRISLRWMVRQLREDLRTVVVEHSPVHSFKQLIGME